jgi:hypothetical protein
MLEFIPFLKLSIRKAGGAAEEGVGIPCCYSGLRFDHPPSRDNTNPVSNSLTTREVWVTFIWLDARS